MFNLLSSKIIQIVFVLLFFLLLFPVEEAYSATCDAGFSCSATKVCSLTGHYECSGIPGCPGTIQECADDPNPDCKTYVQEAGSVTQSADYGSCCSASSNGSCVPGQPCDPGAWPTVSYDRSGGGCGCGGDNFTYGSCSVTWNGPTTVTGSYSCVNNSCEYVEDSSGDYTNLVSCRTNCGNTNPTGQFCSWCTNADQCFSSGGSFQGAGSGWCGAPDGGCCTQPAPPPPPPPSYSCQNDSCSYAGPSPSGQYLGNNCSGNCGIKCTVISNSGTNVGSKDHNSNLCNLGTVTANNNPIQYKITCTAEGSGSRLWHVKSINVPDVGAVNFNSNQSVNNNLTNDSYLASNVNITNPLSGSQTGATTTKMLRYKFNMNTSLPKPADNKVICSNILPADTEPSLLVTYPAANYQEYVTQCYANSETEDNMNTSFSSTLSKANWGTISYNAGSNTFSESTGRIPYLSSTYILSASNTIQVSKGANAIPAIASNLVTSNNYTFSSSDIGKVIIWDISKPTSVDVISAVDTINNRATVLTNDVRVTTAAAILKFQDKTQVRMIVNKGVATTENGVTCTALTSYSSNINNTVDYETICTTDTLGTDALKTEVLRRINLTGYKSVTYSDPNYSEQIITVGNTPRFNSIYGNVTQSSGNTSNTYTIDISLAVPEGLTRANRTITVNVSDNITTAPVNINHVIDTSLPVVEREVTVDSTTLLKVVHKATDDYQLKSHAVYCGPTAYSDSTSSKSAFITERILSSDGLSYSYIGAQQIAGYFGADPSIKTCDGSFLPINNVEQNNDDFKTFATTSTSDTRSTYYLLDENKLKNQNEPYEITFGDGKDGSALGRWYAEDNFCNLPATSPTTTVDVGSPWIQTKGGNAYVQGNNGTRLPGGTFAYNYTVNNVNITTDPNNPGLNICTATKSLTNDQVKTYLGSKNQKSSGTLSSYVNRINQCPENTDTYASSYVMSSAEESSSNGPRGGDRSSKINQESIEYNHKLNNISNYTGGDNNLFDYITKTINTAGIAGYYATGTQVTDTNSELVNESSQLVIKTYSGPTALTINPDAESGNDLLGIMDALISGPAVNGNAVSVYQINNADLIINHNSANLPSEAWEINRNAIILVDGDVYLEPDIIKKQGNLVIAAKGSIVIGNGKYKSASQTKEQVAAGTAYPLYDQIDAFLIADGKVITLPDKGGSSYIASNPIKPIENIASKPEVKLNNEIIKKAEAQTYPCKVIYYKDSGFTQPFTSGEVVTPGQDLYLAVSRTAAGAFSNVGIANVGMRKGSTRINGISLLGSNYQVTVTGSLITTGNNTFEWGYNLNYGNSSDATTGDWCEPFTLTGAVSLNVSGNVYCRDTNNNKSVVSGVTVSLVSGGTTTIGTSDANGNWSGSIYSNTNGSIRPSHTNYPNGSNRLNKASGCFNSNLESISFKSNNTLIDETGQCGDSNQSYYQSTYSFGGETEDRNNLSLSSINFDLGSCVSQNLPTQCTAMTINGGNEDIALTPGSDINISMTVVNPTDTTNKIVVSNRDHKCNDLRAYRAGLAATDIPGYSNMENSTNTPAQWADCIPPATATQITAVFDTPTFSDNGNLRTYTFKIKAEQVLKTDQNTNLPIKSLEFGGPNVLSESLRCKVYAHDNRIVYDGLKIYGGVVQTSTFPKGNNLLHGKTVSMDGVNYSSSLTCKNSGGDYPQEPGQPTTGIGSPCFLRDLIMVQNFVAPAEQIEYDPSFQVIFGSILGRKSTILSIRESTDD